MGTYKTFESDSDLENNGVLLDLGDVGKFKIARAGGANKAYLKALNKHGAPYRAAIQAGSLDDNLALKIVQEVFAEAILLGWEGVTDRDGKPLVFTRENVLRIFNDLPDLFAAIRNFAENAAYYRKSVLAADAGN
jgi:hypothetical protein